ncbi:MAG: alpha-L-arabinofuranosidase C-terminal domain-containing protein, partial [Capsulimonas sp.]|uniref:alpha-L-arabinofuranosidase C-terminal domain-containing protein n=1 Tax=Capsulimonas sp. TaxID=2494211 RepID=UPI003265DD97
IQLYVNGVLQDTAPFDKPWRAQGHLQIGRGKYGGNPVDFTNAQIDDVRAYQGVHIDAAELAALKLDAPALPTVMTIDFTKAGAKINPLMYGLMIEDISHSIDGGLYAELIRNRAFKDDANTPAHWSALPDAGSARIALDMTQPVPSTELTHSLRLDATRAGAGFANEGYWGIPVTPNTKYQASFYAKSDGAYTAPLTVSIQSNDGATVFAKSTVKGVTGEWKKYTVTLATSKSAPASQNNKFVITADAPGSLWFTQVSLFPPTFHNRPNGTRIDLMKQMEAIKPAFLRLPGGNYLEGNTIAERFDWKKTIGPIEQRPGHQDPWGYRSSDGFGLLEYLEWCDDLKMEPILAVFAGFALGHEHVTPGHGLEPFVQDALDEIEYLTGGVDTKWGAVRAKNGHPKPFALRYVEIGNEDFFDNSGSYEERYAAFHDAIKAKYPNLQLIATRADVKSRKPDVIDDHYYQSARSFEADWKHYDKVSRSGPKVFVGEYASQEGVPTPNLKGALGDAAFMAGFERNADLVQISCYAPLLVNVNPGASQWGTNLIGFDALNSYVSPAYYTQQFFSLYHGDTVVPSTSNTEHARGLAYVVSKVSKNGTVYVKAVNPTYEPISTTIQLNGVRSVSPKGTAIVLTSAHDTDTNTIGDPNKVTPVTIPVTGIGKSFQYTFPPNSLTVLTLSVK